MGAQGGSPDASATELPSEQETSPAPRRRRDPSLLGLLGASLILVGAGAVVASSASGGRPAEKVVGRDAPVNAGARNANDISAHNSPTLARNPLRGSNLAVSSRIDTPFFSCSLHVSFDAGASWTQTPIQAPKGEEDKCFAPDVAF